jgi:D-alanyl-D-alanine carboxypeptidase (penicillin-binding protein 5/6)
VIKSIFVFWRGGAARRNNAKATVFSVFLMFFAGALFFENASFASPKKTITKKNLPPPPETKTNARENNVRENNASENVDASSAEVEVDEEYSKGESICSEYNLSNFPSTLAKQAILVDFNSGIVLFSKNADKQTSPSSMTKITTACLVFSRIRTGELTFDTEFVVPQSAYRKEGSSMFLKSGQKVPVGQLLLGLIVQSGNDAAATLAYGICGGEKAFAAEMTSYVRSLGAVNTNFEHASGLPGPLHKTTVRDLATIASHAISAFPEYYDMYSHKDFTFNGVRQFNKNVLLGGDIGCDGMKTGKTDDGGYGIVASVKNGDRRLILVVNGYKTEQERKEDATALLCWGMKTFTNRLLYKANEIVVQVPVWYGNESRLPITVEEDLVITLPRFAERDFKMFVYYDTPVSAPIKKGERVGQIKITSGALKMPIIVPLVASVSVREAGFFKKIYDSLLYLIWGMRAPEMEANAK